MEKCFLLQVHRDTEKISILVDSIISQGGDVFIHVDYKSPDVYFELKEKYGRTESVYFATERKSVYWGAVSQVQATLSLLQTAISKKRYDYYTLLSGECFPIKTMVQFNQFLEVNNGRSFINNSLSESSRLRAEQYHFFINSNLYSIPFFRIMSKLIRHTVGVLGLKNNALRGMACYKGSQWFTMHSSAVEYILEHGFELLSKLRFSSCIDEVFFQTILANSPLKNFVINNNLMYTLWSTSNLNHPRLLSVNDLKQLEEQDIYFARKIDLVNDKASYNYLSSMGIIPVTTKK